MEFIKKNYEKMLLVVVFLGLVAAVVALLIIIPQERARLEDMSKLLTNPRAKPLDQLDLTAENDALQRAQSPVQLDFTTKHKLFNPVLWQMLPGGRLRKIDSDNQIGPGALRILAINPLYLRVSYGEPESDGYLIKVDNEAAAHPYEREKNTIVSTSGPNDLFIVKSITGPPDNPPRLDLEFKDTHEAITVTPDKPYERVAGHTADLSYPPETNLAPWTGLRVGDHLRFEGGDYIVFAINDNSVVVSSRDNNKKTPITFTPTNETR